MKVRQEVVPFIVASVIMGMVVWLVCLTFRVSSMSSSMAGGITSLVLGICMLYFFRDPERTAPQDPAAIVAGADGVLMGIVEMNDDRYLKTDAIRLSIFLSLFNVHVNRAPISGKAKFLGYWPGKRFFTFLEKSSEFNQHNAIVVQGLETRCAICQIVGPVCRRVVYWLDHNREADVEKGDRIGMMKFGSRLDMYFPKGDVEVLGKIGDKVRAGETVIARISARIKP